MLNSVYTRIVSSEHRQPFQHIHEQALTYISSSKTQQKDIEVLILHDTLLRKSDQHILRDLLVHTDAPTTHPIPLNGLKHITDEVPDMIIYRKTITPLNAHLWWLPTTDVVMVTRHAYSCNNANKGKRFGKDLEPSLTGYGIDKTLTLVTNNQKLYDSTFVVVSPLIRTWMTAILLYGTKHDTIRLLVAPHMKEHKKQIMGTRFDRGNMPIDITQQVRKTRSFLDHLSQQTGKPLTIKTIILSFPNCLDGKPHCHNLRLLRKSTQDTSWTFDETTLQAQDPYGLSDITNRAQEAIGNRLYGRRRQRSDTTQWFTSKYYRSDGSLVLFMQWWNQNRHHLYDLLIPIPKVLHIVTHSNVMKQFCSNNDHKCQKWDVNYKKFTKQNSWSLRFDNTNDRQEILSMREGVPQPTDDDGKYTLCGSE
jgi:hypothetical protein